MNNFSLREYYKLQGKDLKDGNEEDFINEDINLVFWYDNIAEFGDVKKETVVKNNTDGTQLVRHERADGVVFQEGTYVNAQNLGQMEWNDLINSYKINYLMDLVRRMAVELATLKGGISNNMPFNQFVVDARNIDKDLVIIEGYYDVQSGRGIV